MVAAFAAAFPEEFAGQVVRQYSYALPPQEFWGSWGSSLFLGNMHYPLADLKRDLARMESVSPEVIQSVRRYRTRTIIFGVASAAGSATAIVAMFIGANMEGRDVLDEETNRQLLITFGTGGLVGIAALIPILLPPPRKLITTLNDWCCAE